MQSLQNPPFFPSPSCLWQKKDLLNILKVDWERKGTALKHIADSFWSLGMCAPVGPLVRWLDARGPFARASWGVTERWNGSRCQLQWDKFPNMSAASDLPGKQAWRELGSKKKRDVARRKCQIAVRGWTSGPQKSEAVVACGCWQFKREEQVS